MKRTTGRRPGRGFALVELLMAAVLTVVVAAVALYFGGVTLARWERSAGRIRTATTARLVFDQLQQDLQGAIFRADGGVWMAVTVLPDTGLSGRWEAAAVATHAKPGNTHRGTLNLAPERLDEARFGIAGVWWRFFTTKPDDNSGVSGLSAPVAVGFQVIRRRVTSSPTSPPRYLLFRAEVRRTRTPGGAPGTFEAGYDLDPSATPSTAYQAPNATAGDPGNLIRPPLGSVIADNVIDFGVRLYVREGGVLRLVFPAAAAARDAAPAVGTLATEAPPSPEATHLARSGARAPEDYYRHVFPEVADVMVRVLTDEGARLTAAYESGSLQPPAGVSADDYWWTLAEAHSLVFTRRITIPSGVL